MMGVTSVRLSSEVEAPLANLAHKLDRSKNYIINQAIKEYVQRQSMEDLRWEETLEALNSVKSGKVVDADEVALWLESWGTDNELSPPQA